MGSGVGLGMAVGVGEGLVVGVAVGWGNAVGEGATLAGGAVEEGEQAGLPKAKAAASSSNAGAHRRFLSIKVLRNPEQWPGEGTTGPQ